MPAWMNPFPVLHKPLRGRGCCCVQPRALPCPPRAVLRGGALVRALCLHAPCCLPAHSSTPLSPACPPSAFAHAHMPPHHHHAAAPPRSHLPRLTGRRGRAPASRLVHLPVISKASTRVFSFQGRLSVAGSLCEHTLGLPVLSSCAHAPPGGHHHRRRRFRIQMRRPTRG